MSLQFIVGRAGSGKTSYCIEEIHSILIKEPQGAPLVYIVPEQMTFQTEYHLASSPQLGGMIRAQVFSFTRLAWKVLQEEGGLARQHIQRVGIHMLLRKIIESKKDELQLFQGARDKTGFIDLVEEMVQECKQYCISPEKMAQTYQDLLGQEEGQQRNILLAKLHDFQLIFAELELALQDHYLASEDYLQLLAEKIPHSTYLAQAQIWIDGFHHFTPQELMVLKALLIHCPKVSLTLTMDPQNISTSGELQQDLHYLDLFYLTSKTYQRIYTLATQAGVNIVQPISLPQDSEQDLLRFRKEPQLARLEEEYAQRRLATSSKQAPSKSMQGEVRDEEQGIRLLAAVHARAEVEGVAQEIIRLVREKGYRYRELAIMVRNVDDYYELLQTTFADYDLPLFVDQKRSMLFHPLIELIRSALDVITGGWRYDALFRCVKTDLLCPVGRNIQEWREEMDKLENYVLAYGIYGSRWIDGQAWEYRRQSSLEEEGEDSAQELAQRKKINQWREEISAPLYGLQQALTVANNAQEMCSALFYFLEEIDVPQKIETWRNTAEVMGNLEEAREHDQVWRAVLELLEQMVEIIGTEELSLSLFAQILESGLESMRFALVPPALDQVVVAAMGRSRLPAELKCVFLLGVNDGVIPAKPEEGGLLTAEDRLSLAANGLELAPGSTGQLIEEPFLIYNALASASERLWLSYPLADQEGKALLPSNLIQRIKDLFPELQEELLLAEPEAKPDVDARELRFLSRPAPALAYLAGQLHKWKQGQEMAPFWWDVYSWFRTEAEWRERSQARLTGLFYQNKEDSLEQATSRSLYGQHLKVSVSRLERFGACPFAHFISYGLRLQERPIFRLEAPDIGQLFHAALKLIAEQLWSERRNWADLHEQECQYLADEMVERLAPKLQSEILFSSKRYHYILRKLKQVVKRATHMLSKQASQSGFSPVAVELAFGGEDAPLPSIQFSLANGCTLELIGRIDRVDQAQSSQGILLRVIDYKSSQTSLDMAEIYYGLTLQMLTYIDVLITHAVHLVGEEALPAGVLYFHLHNPLISSKKTMLLEEVEEEIFKRFKMKGLVLADQEVVRIMDTQLESNHSRIIPVGLKRDGGFYSNSAVVSKEEFSAIRSYTRQVIQEMGTQLTEGVIEIAPYKLKKKIACTFCSYRSICQFDSSLIENEYRLLSADKKDVFLAKIVEKGGGRDG